MSRGALQMLKVWAASAALATFGLTVAAADGIGLRPVTWEEWQGELAALRGSPVVVELWATWCLPCKDRFPHLVKLAREYGPRGVVFVSLSLDDPGDPIAIAEAERFLAEQGASFPNFRLEQEITESFAKLDLLGIPAVFIYDEEGKLQQRLTTDDPRRQFTDRDLERAVGGLVSKAAASSEPAG